MRVKSEQDNLSFDQKTARNLRVQKRYDELMQIGEHGHYETMFQVVHEQCELAVRQQKEMRFKHDCKNCTPIGQYAEYDLYSCMPLDGPSIICRYGNEPEENCSYPLALFLPCLKKCT